MSKVDIVLKEFFRDPDVFADARREDDLKRKEEQRKWQLDLRERATAMLADGLTIPQVMRYTGLSEREVQTLAG